MAQIVYIVGEHGTFLNDMEGATAYLADLQKRYAGDPEYDHMEIKEYPVGRNAKHGKLVWAGEAVWDLFDQKLLGFARSWLWDSELMKIEDIRFTVGKEYNRFVPVFAAETEESKLEQRCKRSLSFYRTTLKPDGINVTILG